jgi:flagellar biosynthesis chaperone FliJ
MSTKLNNMKNELVEIQPKMDEIIDKQQKILHEWSDKCEKGIATNDEGQKVMEEVNVVLGAPLGQLQMRRDELINKIRIREEALDLLQELGIIDDNLKQSSIMNTIKSLF